LFRLFRRCYLLFLAFSLPLLVACGGSSAWPEPTPTAELSANEILARSSQRIAETNTLRFHLGIEGVNYIDPANTIQLLEADGELQRPDGVHVRFKIKVVPGVTITTELITIGDQHWTTDLITGEWGEAPYEFTYDPTVLFDNQGGVGPVMNKVSDAKVVGTEKVQGKECFHITATANEDIVGPVTSNTMHGSPVSTNLWIDVNTYDLLRAELEEPASSGNPNPAKWTLDLFDQDEPNSIEPPI
jgi:LppX/LprAFG-like lipoprotein